MKEKIDYMILDLDSSKIYYHINKNTVFYRDFRFYLLMEISTKLLDKLRLNLIGTILIVLLPVCFQHE